MRVHVGAGLLEAGHKVLALSLHARERQCNLIKVDVAAETLELLGPHKVWARTRLKRNTTHNYLFVLVYFGKAYKN